MILWHSNSYLNVNIDTCKDLQGSIISGVGLFLLSSPIMYFFLQLLNCHREKLVKIIIDGQGAAKNSIVWDGEKFNTGLILFI